MKTKNSHSPAASPASQLSLLFLSCILVPFFKGKKSMKDAMMDFHNAMSRYCNYFPCAITPKVIKSVSSDFEPRIVIAIATDRA